MEERTLVARAKEGDARALSRLVDLEVPALRARVERRLPRALRRKVGISDVVQEALIVATRRLGEFEYQGPGSFGAWLGRIADYSVQNARHRFGRAAKRRAAREVAHDPSKETAEPIDPQASPSEVAGAKDLRRAIAAAIGRLPDDYRAVIELLQDRRLTVAEAAVVLTRSENAVKKLHARAIERISRDLGLSRPGAPGEASGAPSGHRRTAAGGSPG